MGDHIKMSRSHAFSSWPSTSKYEYVLANVRSRNYEVRVDTYGNTIDSSMCICKKMLNKPNNNGG